MHNAFYALDLAFEPHTCSPYTSGVSTSFFILYEADAHTHRRIQTHTDTAYSSVKLPSQRTSSEGLRCHDNDEVRGLEEEFDPD